jgi:hypothetical protein
MSLTVLQQKVFLEVKNRVFILGFGTLEDLKEQ